MGDYRGDLRLGDTIDVKFNTYTTAGVPATLADTPAVSAYPDNSTAKITAGITLTVDFDSLTGYHNVRVVVSSTGGYTAGKNYSLAITAGKVGSTAGISVVGSEVGSFSVEHRSALRPVTAGREITVFSNGRIDLGAWLGGTPSTLVAQLVPTQANQLGTQAKADVNAEADQALVDYDAVVPADLPSNFANLAITPTSGHVTVGTNNDKTGYSISGAKQTLDALNDLSTAQVNAEVDAALDTAIPVTPTTGSINERIKTMDDADIPAAITALNDLSTADVETVISALLDTAIPVSPTAGSINQRIKAIDELTEASGDGDLAAILADTDEVQGDLANGGRIDLLIDAIKAKTDNLPGAIAKGAALSNMKFLMVSTGDHITPSTGLTITAEVSKDSGSFAAAASTVSEVGSGVYRIDLTTAEMNADSVTLKFTASGADQRVIEIRTDS